jgi:hypothetical protein
MEDDASATRSDRTTVTLACGRLARKAAGLAAGYAMSSKDSAVVSVIPCVLSIVVLVYGAYELASHQHLHIV